MFDIIVRNDYVYEKDSKDENDKLTSVRISWPYYTILINFIAYFTINFISTIVLYKLLVNWFDQLLYSDDTILNIFLTSEERREFERERN